MNTFDILLLAFACVLVLVGMVKGLVRILIGLAALIAAFALAARYHDGLAARMTAVEIGVDALRLIAYLLIFIGVMLAGGLLAYLARKLLRAAMLGWADRLGGAAVGLVAAMLTAALIVLPVVAYSPRGQGVLAASVLAPYVTAVADVATKLAPEELSARYREQVEGLRQLWREKYLEAEAPLGPNARNPASATGAMPLLSGAVAKGT